jgi:anti-anti-sigma regulatory factor
LHVKGEVDASNYQHLVAQAQEAYQSGARSILIDLSEVPFMASSGLVALHNIAVLMRGETPADPSAGWGAIRAIDRDLERGPQQRVKLLNPQPRVDRVLEMAGFKRLFELYNDQETAVASF